MKKLNLNKMANTNENAQIKTSTKKITHLGIKLEGGKIILNREFIRTFVGIKLPPCYYIKEVNLMNS